MDSPSRSNHLNLSPPNPPEAHEVHSVRKKVEGMGVENQPELQAPIQTTADGAVIHHNESSQQEDNGLVPNDPDQTNSDQAHDPKIPSHPLPPPTTTSNQSTTTWDTQSTLQVPTARVASKTDSSIIAQSVVTPSSSQESNIDPPLARAFAPSQPFPNHLGSNSSCPSKFPSGSDFFLKGKRNTPLTDSSPDADPESATQNKKLKLPPSPSSRPVPASSESSSSKNFQHGFASYAMGSSTSLKSRALDKLNSTPSLQISSHEPATAISNYSMANQPSSKASSACAVNGEADDSVTPALSTSSALSGGNQASTQGNNSLGFSAFTNTSGFHDSSKSAINWSNRPASSSVFDEQTQPPSTSSHQLEAQAENTEWGAAQSTGKKTHLALSAGLSEEDKHEGFLATEVITGEENEDLIKSVRCKMFTLVEDGSWRERGTGGLRLLRTREKPYRFRLIMRADAVLRVLLNVPIFKGFSYRPTQDKFLTFASTVVVSNNNEDEKPVNGSDGAALDSSNGRHVENNTKTHFQQYLCRFGKTEARQEMIDEIEECLKEIERFPSFKTKEASQGAEEVVDPEEGNFDASDLV